MALFSGGARSRPFGDEGRLDFGFGALRGRPGPHVHRAARSESETPARHQDGKAVPVGRLDHRALLLPLPGVAPADEAVEKNDQVLRTRCVVRGHVQANLVRQRLKLRRTPARLGLPRQHLVVRRRKEQPVNRRRSPHPKTDRPPEPSIGSHLTIRRPRRTRPQCRSPLGLGPQRVTDAPQRATRMTTITYTVSYRCQGKAHPSNAASSGDPRAWLLPSGSAILIVR